MVADLIGIHAGEYLITEAGFGSDMGAEAVLQHQMPDVGLVPDAAVVVATVRALKLHSGRHKVVAGRPLPPAMLEENPEEVPTRCGPTSWRTSGDRAAPRRPTRSSP